MKLSTASRRSRAGRGVRALAVISGLLLLTSCEDGVTDPSDLSGTWRLEALRLPGGQDMPPSDPSRFTVEFGADGQLTARADCNGCGGGYTLGNDTLLVENPTCTLIACPSAPYDGQFLEILAGASEIDLDDDRLTLSSSRGTLRLMR
jgi:heat shock protein HslJ